MVDMEAPSARGSDATRISMDLMTAAVVLSWIGCGGWESRLSLECFPIHLHSRKTLAPSPSGIALAWRDADQVTCRRVVHRHSEPLHARTARRHGRVEHVSQPSKPKIRCSHCALACFPNAESLDAHYRIWSSGSCIIGGGAKPDLGNSPFGQPSFMTGALLQYLARIALYLDVNALFSYTKRRYMYGFG